MTDEEASFMIELDIVGNHTAMLVFADWLGDRDDPREAGYREMARLRFYPYYADGSRNWGAIAQHWLKDWVNTNRVLTETAILSDEWLVAATDDVSFSEVAWQNGDALFCWSKFAGLFTVPDKKSNRPSTLIDALAVAYAKMMAGKAPLVTAE